MKFFTLGPLVTVSFQGSSALCWLQSSSSKVFSEDHAASAAPNSPFCIYMILGQFRQNQYYHSRACDNSRNTHTAIPSLQASPTWDRNVTSCAHRTNSILKHHLFFLPMKPSSVLLLHPPVPAGSPAAATCCLCCHRDGRHPAARY